MTTLDTRVGPAPGPAALAASREFTLTARDFSRIAAIVHADAGIALPESKINLVYSRLAKRLRLLGLQDFHEYCALITDPAHRDEREAMIAALTTNVTNFFREAHHFEHLKTAIVPAMRRAAERGERIRLWSAACSSGQEPYSIALAVLSAWPEALLHDVKILATDIDQNVLRTGALGVYEAPLMKQVPPAMRQRWFRPAPQGAGLPAAWEAGEELRTLVAFRRLNLIADWPMRGPFHAIFCRNVVIYFDSQTQSRLWSRLAGLLAPDGALYIGHSERVTGEAERQLVSDGTTTYRPAPGPAASA